MGKLDGKIALVTGGNSGIGLRIEAVPGTREMTGRRNPDTDLDRRARRFDWEHMGSQSAQRAYPLTSCFQQAVSGLLVVTLDPRPEVKGAR